ncbi:MAG TPA: hypothetical protein VMZ28_07675, partial [Kofleriaceae bacterium]|nr:hypothetical protein [Kofleriaceae bacterium]
MALGRRAFLLGSAGLAAAGLTAARLLQRGPAVATADRGMVVGAFQQLNLRTQKPMFSLSIVDQQGNTFRDVALDFHFHGFAPDPLDPGRAALFQKKGPGACEVDLRAGRVVRPIE